MARDDFVNLQYVGINFAERYLFARHGCRNNCLLGMGIDLVNKAGYRPPEIAKIIAAVNSLSPNASRKLDISEYRDYSFKRNSNSLLIRGAFSKGTDQRGVYYLKWENNKFKLTSKIEKILSHKKQSKYFL